MKIKRILQPDQPGTKKLVERYGDNLLCVRYRYDNEKMTMFKTIEIIIDRRPWQPGLKEPHKNKLVNLHIAYNDMSARKQVKAAGGIWDPKRKIWQLVYEKVLELGMENRIVNEEA
jgi:hypothetical protein